MVALAMSQPLEAPTLTAISVRRASKMFGTFGGKNAVLALEDVSFEVSEQEFVSSLGPSGCGKSTLLRIIAGLIPFDGEAVSVSSRPVSGPMEDVGVVFQTANLLPWRTIEANLGLGIEIRGSSSQRQPQEGPKRVN